MRRSSSMPQIADALKHSFTTGNLTNSASVCFADVPETEFTPAKDFETVGQQPKEMETNMRLDISEFEVRIYEYLSRAGTEARKMRALMSSKEEGSAILDEVETVCEDVFRTFDEMVKVHRTTGASLGGFRALLVGLQEVMHNLLDDMRKSQPEIQSKSCKKSENAPDGWITGGPDASPLAQKWSERDKYESKGRISSTVRMGTREASSTDLQHQNNAENVPPVELRSSVQMGAVRFRSPQDATPSDTDFLEGPSASESAASIRSGSDEPKLSSSVSATPATSGGSSSGSSRRSKHSRRQSMSSLLSLTSSSNNDKSSKENSDIPLCETPLVSFKDLKKERDKEWDKKKDLVKENVRDRSEREKKEENANKEGSAARKMRKRLQPHLYQLKVLSKKMKLCVSIMKKEAPNGRFMNGLGTFSLLDDLFKLHPNEDPAAIDASYHLGFEYDPNLKEYAKKLKIVYCAAHESLRGTRTMKMVNFNKAGMQYLDEKKALLQYEVLRDHLDIVLLREVWNLMEDPVIRFFASQLGMAPKEKRVGTDSSVWIPVQLRSYAPSGSRSAAEAPKVVVRCRFIAAAKLKPSESLKKKRAMEMTRGHSLVDYMHEQMDLEENKIDDDEEEEVQVLERIKSSDDAETAAEMLGYKKKKPVRRVISRTASKFALGNRQAVKVKHEKQFAVDLQDSHASESIDNAVVLHIHGGGFVSQSPETHKPYLEIWTRETGLPIVSVDYALSPEYVFPYALDQCFGVYKFLLSHDNVASLGIPVDRSRPMKVFVTGDSAGGNLTAAITIRAILEGLQKPNGTMLTYPATNLSSAGSIARLIYMNDPLLNYQTMNIVLACYLGAKQPLADIDPLISPAVANDELLSHFPPTAICTGDVDPLVDDSGFFFERLRTASQSPTMMKVYTGLPHGYLNVPSQIPRAWPAIHEAAAFLRWLVRRSNM